MWRSVNWKQELEHELNDFSRSPGSRPAEPPPVDHPHTHCEAGGTPSFKDYLRHRQIMQDMVVPGGDEDDGQMGANHPCRGGDAALHFPPIAMAMPPKDESVAPTLANSAMERPVLESLPPLRAPVSSGLPPPIVPAVKKKCKYVFDLPNNTSDNFLRSMTPRGMRRLAHSHDPSNSRANSIVFSPRAFAGAEASSFVDPTDLTFKRTSSKGLDRVGSLRFCPRVDAKDLEPEAYKPMLLSVGSMRPSPSPHHPPPQRLEEIDVIPDDISLVATSGLPSIAGTRASSPQHVQHVPPPLGLDKVLRPASNGALSPAPSSHRSDALAEIGAMLEAIRQNSSDSPRSGRSTSRPRKNSRPSTNRRHSYSEPLLPDGRVPRGGGTGTPVFAIDKQAPAPAIERYGPSSRGGRRPKVGGVRANVEASIGRDVSPWDGSSTHSPTASLALAAAEEAGSASPGSEPAPRRQASGTQGPDSPLTVCKKTLSEFQQSGEIRVDDRPALDEGDEPGSDVSPSTSAPTRGRSPLGRGSRAGSPDPRRVLRPTVHCEREMSAGSTASSRSASPRRSQRLSLLNLDPDGFFSHEPLDAAQVHETEEVMRALCDSLPVSQPDAGTADGSAEPDKFPGAVDADMPMIVPLIEECAVHGGHAGSDVGAGGGGDGGESGTTDDGDKASDTSVHPLLASQIVAGRLVSDERPYNKEISPPVSPTVLVEDEQGRQGGGAYEDAQPGEESPESAPHDEAVFPPAAAIVIDAECVVSENTHDPTPSGAHHTATVSVRSPAEMSMPTPNIASPLSPEGVGAPSMSTQRSHSGTTTPPISTTQPRPQRRPNWESDDDTNTVDLSESRRRVRKPSITPPDRQSRLSRASDTRSSYSPPPGEKSRAKNENVMEIIEQRFRQVTAEAAGGSELTFDEMAQLGVAQRWKLLERAGVQLSGPLLAGYGQYHREVREVAGVAKGAVPPSEMYSPEHSPSPLMERSLSLLPGASLRMRGGSSRSPSIVQGDEARRSSVHASSPPSLTSSPVSRPRGRQGSSSHLTPPDNLRSHSLSQIDTTPPQFHALIIAVTRYNDGKLPVAPRLSADAYALREVLQRVGYTVHWLHSEADDPEQHPTHANILREAEAFTGRAAPKCHQLLYFIGACAMEALTRPGSRPDGLQLHLVPQDYVVPALHTFGEDGDNSLPLEDTFDIRRANPETSALNRIFGTGEKVQSRGLSTSRPVNAPPEPVVIIDSIGLPSLKGLSTRAEQGFAYILSGASPVADFAVVYGARQENILTHYFMRGISGAASRDGKLSSTVMMGYLQKCLERVGFKDGVSFKTTSESFYGGAVLVGPDSVVTQREDKLVMTEQRVYPARFVLDGWLVLNKANAGMTPHELRRHVGTLIDASRVYEEPEEKDREKKEKTPSRRRSIAANRAAAANPHDAAVKQLRERFGIQEWQLMSVLASPVLLVQLEEGSHGAKSVDEMDRWEADIAAWAGGVPGIRFTHRPFRNDVLITMRRGRKERVITEMAVRYAKGEVRQLAGVKIKGVRRGCNVSYSGTAGNYLRADELARAGKTFGGVLDVDEVYPWVGGWRYHAATLMVQRRWRGHMGRKVYHVVRDVTAMWDKTREEVEAEWLEGMVAFHHEKMQEQQDVVFDAEVVLRADYEVWEAEDRELIIEQGFRAVTRTERIGRREITDARDRWMHDIAAELALERNAVDHAALISLCRILSKTFEKTMARATMIAEEEAKARSNILYDFKLKR